MCLTKGMLPLRFLLLLLPVVFIGCSANDTSPQGGNIDANGQQVSSVPWNKPESWKPAASSAA